MTARPVRSILALAIVALALFAAALPAQARGWLRAEAPGIVVLSDGFPHELQRWTLKVQLIDALLRRELGAGDRPDDPGSPLTIYLLEDGKAVEQLTGRDNLHGLYSPSSEGSYLIASRAPGYDRTRLSGEMTLFHEYAHHFMYRHFASAYPAWYREGFAEYVGAVSFDADWNARLGAPAWPRLKALEGKPMPLATILTASVDTLPESERVRFYAWSWKLVHMFETQPGERFRLERCLRLFARGRNPTEAAQSAFGDLAALEKKLHAYVPDPRGGRTIALAGVASTHVETSALDPLAARLADLRLARLAGANRKATLAQLALLVEAYPRSAEARRELALATRDTATGKDSAATLAEALVHADAALALAPGDLRSIAVRADIAFRRLAAIPGARPADWDAARARLELAIGPETRDPFALVTWFRSFLTEPRRPPPAALAAMERAMALQPESYEIRFLDIYAKASQGRLNEARAAARVMASDPHAAEMGKRALDMLDRTRIEKRAR
jgi:hypothetical protein